MTEQLHFHFSLSCIGGGNGNPLQCSCLENPRDKGAWWAAVNGVAQSRTRQKWLSSSYDPMDCSTPVFPVHHQLPELSQTHVHRCGDAIEPSHPLSPPTPSEFNLSQHQALFQWVSCLHQVAKVLELSISASNEHSGLISFRIDWLDLLAVQGTLKSLLQHHSSKASVLRCSAFFMVNSHRYGQFTWLLEKP